MSELTDEEKKQNETEASEWDEVFDGYEKEKGVESPADDNKPDDDTKVDDVKDDIKPDDDTKKDPPENETDEQKAEREKKEAEDATAAKDDTPPAKGDDPTARTRRDARATQKELEAEEEAVKQDIRETIYKDKLDRTLKDSDGDPIRTIEDVQRLKNPVTGKNFTEDEAGDWLLKAQGYRNEQVDKAEKEIEELAEVTISLKDQADRVKELYGDFLSKPENKELAAQIWADYHDTLEVDKDTDIVLKAPVSMEKHYQNAMRGYMRKEANDAAADTAAAEAAKKKEAEEAAEKKRIKELEEENKRLRTRTDREDIIPTGKQEPKSKEDKEWEAAEKAVYS